MGITSQVSGSDPAIMAGVHVDLCVFPSDENAGDTREEERESAVASIGTR